MEAVRGYTWPGNVRELISRLRRAAVMTDDAEITVANLELPTRSSDWLCALDRVSEDSLTAEDSAKLVASGPISLEEARFQVERLLITRALERNDRNMTATARDLGVSRVTLYRLIEKHSLRATCGAKASGAEGAETASPANFV